MFVSVVNAELNGPCNRRLFSLGTIPLVADEIHESAKRLYEVAEKLLQVTGQTALAKLLNESPQAVNNWESRGVSERGALKAQAVIGCDANWLLTGEGSAHAGWPFPRVSAERYLSLDAENRAWVQARVQQAIEECEPGPQRSDADVLSQARPPLGGGAVKKSKLG